MIFETFEKNTKQIILKLFVAFLTQNCTQSQMAVTPAKIIQPKITTIYITKLGIK